MRVVVEKQPRRLADEVARSRALLEDVAGGVAPETFRLYRTSPAIAFGPVDRMRPGYEAARRATERRGIDSVLRLAGGRPVAFHEGTIGLSWTIADGDGRRHIGDRFEVAAVLCRDALRALGVDARIGEARGEYCPGRYSVNAAGVTKLVGLGQRLVRGGVHLGGVVVVTDEARVRSMLDPVYAELGIEWDPATTGSVAGALGIPISLDDVEEAIVDALAKRRDVVGSTP